MMPEDLVTSVEETDAMTARIAALEAENKRLREACEAMHRWFADHLEGFNADKYPPLEELNAALGGEG